MHYSALIPGFIVLWLLSRIGLIPTFLTCFIPLMVLVPDYYKAQISGLPDLSFLQGAIIPIALATIYQYRGNWKPRLMDLVVCGLAGIAVLSEFLAAGYAEAQNYVVDMLCYIVFPYFVGRLLIEQNNLRMVVVKRILYAAIVVVILMAYEWRFAINPYQQLIARFFPGQGDGWIVTFRFGMTRAAGPYAHAILAGIMFAIYYRLNRWVMWQGGWPAKFPWYPNHPLSFPLIMWLVIAGGVFMNGAKGPWLGALLAAVIVTASRVRFRKLYIRLLLVFGLAVVVPSAVEFWQFASVGRAAARTANQETAAYRKELIDHYVQVAMDHAELGWGKNNVPKVPGQDSIDNYFLLIALQHGVYACGLLVFIFLFNIVRLWRRANRESDLYPDSEAFGWTLLGIFIMYMIALATVFMAYQIMLMFFLLTGWTETYLQRGLEHRDQGAAKAPPPAATPRFRRVLA